MKIRTTRRRLNGEHTRLIGNSSRTYTMNKYGGNVADGYEITNNVCVCTCFSPLQSPSLLCPSSSSSSPSPWPCLPHALGKHKRDRFWRRDVLLLSWELPFEIVETHGELKYGHLNKGSLSRSPESQAQIICKVKHCTKFPIREKTQANYSFTSRNSFWGLICDLNTRWPSKVGS